MSYASYVLAAWLAFAAMLLWDFVAPRIRIRRVQRAARLLQARRAASTRSTQELSR